MQHGLHTARALYEVALYALTTALRHDTHLATAYFSTKKGNRAIVQNTWDQKCMVNRTKLIARQMTIIIE